MRQVVELPREAPEAALRLFSEVPGLRVLVVGGDGTVGWILGCLDSLQAEFAAQPEPFQWQLPPVAILPLGTGTCHPASFYDLLLYLAWYGISLPPPIGSSTSFSLSILPLKHLNSGSQ